MPLERLAILGAGGHGRSVAAAARAQGWQEIGFFDPGYDGGMTTNGDWPVIASDADLPPVKNWTRFAIVAVGDNALRLKLLDALKHAGFECVNVIHPTAWLCPSVKQGIGNVYLAQTAVNYGCEIGDGVIVNTGATVDHDCALADGAQISPGVHLAGTIQVGRQTSIGTGSSIRPNITIGEDCVIGAGSTIVKDIAGNSTVYGVAAKVR